MADYDVIVLGAGAAGLMCAIEAGKRGRKVLVLERSEKPGKKILISGGGRCNFTNKNTTYKSFLSENPDFCRSALSRYTQNDFIYLVEQYNIEYYEKKDGQLFCKESARQILDMLLKECKLAGIEIITNIRATIETNYDAALPSHGQAKFILQTNQGEFTTTSLVIATGGPSIPKMGATTFGYDVASKFGLNVIEPKPALVPLLFAEQERGAFGDIAGISFRGKVTDGKVSFEDDILFTHRGLSGPAILQVSSYWKEGDAIEIDLLPQLAGEPLERKHKKIPNILSEFLPHRLADKWCAYFHFTGYLDQLSNKDTLALEDNLHHWKIFPAGTEGFEKAEVTIGGIDTKELSSKTMETLKIPSLYFIGEVVDVTGRLGGYNFQWAWSSGWAAGQVA